MTFARVNLKSFLLPLFVTSIFFISCQDAKETNNETTDSVQEATLEQKKQLLDNSVPASQSGDTPAASGALNPAHGQPGHRCDIAVGAPLDGSPAMQTNPGQASPIQVQSTSPSGSTGEGLNPPHGQPGHRCDVKVGDPL